MFSLIEFQQFVFFVNMLITQSDSVSRKLVILNQLFNF